ncbi:FtsX-like permease family protein [Paenibacillus lautus]|uniref:FtsX-like permease family protein n=1 Tax=Paenibacillus lautus TaxID=1401 RepID=UPI003D289034
MAIFKLSIANMKKAKSATISLFIMILIAAMLLNMGLTLMNKMSHFYENKTMQLDEAHLSIAMNKDSFEPSYEDFFRAYPGVEKTKTEQIILLPMVTIRYKKTDFSTSAAILNADLSRTIAPLRLIEESRTELGRRIYLPFSLKVNGDYRLGDHFKLTYQNKTYGYRVAGFFESTLMGSTRLGMLKFYLPGDDYSELSRELGSSASGVLMSATFKNSEHSSEMLRDYHENFSYSNHSKDAGFWSGDIKMAKDSTVTVDMIAMILIAFAVVLVLVSVIVIDFQISNSIDDGMVNIGVLKALGYTGRQIISSMVFQFMLVSFAGSIAGIIASYMAMPAFYNVFSNLNKLLWPGGPHPGTDLASVLIVSLLVLIVVLFSSIRIRRLHPIVALRGGMATHNFKRNWFPLDKARGGLQFVLGRKNLIHNLKLNIMTVGIIASITFASVFSVVLYYNMAQDKTDFFLMIGTETPDIGIQVAAGKDSEALLRELKQMEGVKKAIIQDTFATMIDGQMVTAEFSDDFKKLNANKIFKGRYPEFDNEIAISGRLARRLDKDVGDMISVGTGKNTHDYLITGLSQEIRSALAGVSLTPDGAERVIDGHKGMSINVYLDDPGETDMVSRIEDEYGNRIQAITDVKESLKSQSADITFAIFSLMTSILVITLLILFLILYLAVNTIIRKRKRELGVLRAIGYTTFQLRTQIALGFMPVVVLGVMVGGVFGSRYFNSVLKLMLFDSGAANMKLIVNLPLVIILCTAIILVSYAVSMLVSRRIKQITPYGLITD